MGVILPFHIRLGRIQYFYEQLEFSSKPVVANECLENKAGNCSAVTVMLN